MNSETKVPKPAPTHSILSHIPNPLMLTEFVSSIGAGAAISLGKKMRALTASNATTKTKTIRKGAIYWRKIDIGMQ